MRLVGVMLEERKKITIILLHLHFGGVEKSVSDIANILSDSYDVRLVVIYKIARKPAFQVDDNVEILYLTKYKPNRKELSEAIHSKKFPLILSEGIKSLKILFLRQNCVKKYLRENDSDIIISTRVLFHNLVEKYASPKSIKIAQEHTYHNNNRKIIRKTMKLVRNFDYFMPVSSEMTKFFKAKLKNEKVKLKYIPHMIDDYPNHIDFERTGELILVSRFSPEKNILDAIKVMECVIKVDPKAILNIYGDGVEFDRLKEYIINKNLIKNIILHGFQKREVINEKLKASSMCIMTSNVESFGLVLIEAMAYGVVPIAFDSARGAVEIIDDRYGYLVSNRDIKKMAELILRLNHTKELQNKSTECYQYVKKFSKEKIKEGWLEFLND